MNNAQQYLLSAKKTLNVDELKSILYNSAVPVPNMTREKYGFGIINAYNSLENIDAKFDSTNGQSYTLIGNDVGAAGSVCASIFYPTYDNQYIYVALKKLH